MLNNRGSNIHRDAWVEINLGHLEENVLNLKKNIPDNVKLMAVIKADAYGHGSLMCAPTLLACGISAFAVASIDEAMEMRHNKFDTDILVLGTVPIWTFETALNNNIAISIFNSQHLEVIEELYKRTGKKVKAHIKIDTGMNRIGIDIQSAVNFIKKAQNADYVDLRGIFTHFADFEDDALFNMQFSAFKNILSQIDTSGLIIHCANSGAILERDCFYNMARLGITLYGLSPFTDKKVNYLKQVMGLKGRITNIHTIQKGEGVSYCHKFIADKLTRVATIPIGYADGVARSLSNKIEGISNGQKIKQIGSITMDQMMFDITDIENARVGDIITLLNDELTVNDWAKKLNTINYELTCRLKVRLPRIYTREE